MNARAAAVETAKTLALAGVPDAAFEAEYLVRTAGGLSRAQFFADAAFSASDALATMTTRRVAREPAAYITGTREFFGRPFGVGPGVLVPRPETELLVELALAEARDGDVVADIGTGSGCIALSVALHLQAGAAARVVAIDLSADALVVAEANRLALGANATLVRGNLASPLGRADIVLANLPYIPAGEIDALEPEVSRWEPRVALDGGPDGFALIRRLVADCAERLRPRVLALEVGFGQAAEVAAIARAQGASVSLTPDLSGIDRLVVARWA